MKIKSPFWRVVHRELKENLFGQWPYLFITCIGPLIGFLLVTWIFSSNVPRNLPVAVVDMDHTMMSRKMANMTDATPIAVINRSYVSLEDAHSALQKGDVDAILYIPSGTEKGILNGGSSTVALYLNMSNVLKGSLLSSGIQKALGTLSAGIKLQYQMLNGATEEQAMSRIMPILLRPVVLFNPYISYSYFLTFCLLPVILLVFVLLGSVYTIGNELQYGLGPEWLEAADENIGIALAGKLLPYTFLFYCLAMIINLILFRYLGLPLRGNLHVILISEFLLILSYQFIAIFLIGLSANLRLSMSLGSAYSMLAITYSGLTFPIFGMPAFAQAFARIFPFTYWLKIFISQTLRGEPVSNGIIPMYAFFAFILLGILFIPRLKTLMKTEKYWGKL